MANLGAQYVLDLMIHDSEGKTVDHAQIESILETAINDAMEAININTGLSVSLIQVEYETDYPILPPEEL